MELENLVWILTTFFAETFVGEKMERITFLATKTYRLIVGGGRVCVIRKKKCDKSCITLSFKLLFFIFVYFRFIFLRIVCRFLNFYVDTDCSQ